MFMIWPIKTKKYYVFCTPPIQMFRVECDLWGLLEPHWCATGTHLSKETPPGTERSHMLSEGVLTLGTCHSTLPPPS